jgi:hypothetical protein
MVWQSTGAGSKMIPWQRHFRLRPHYPGVIMKTIRTLSHIIHRPALLGLSLGVLVAAFAAGAITAQTLSAAHPPGNALRPAAIVEHPAGAIDSHAIGRDVYTPRGTPLGRLTAIIRGTDTGSSFALISTYDRDASLAGEIAIPVAQLDLRGDRIVFDTDGGRIDDPAPRRWLL